MDTDKHGWGREGISTADERSLEMGVIANWGRDGKLTGIGAVGVERFFRPARGARDGLWGGPAGPPYRGYGFLGR